ncbi:MAG: hypothetical protein NVS3B25_28940 [Hymenobacter sp.]
MGVIPAGYKGAFPPPAASPSQEPIQQPVKAAGVTRGWSLHFQQTAIKQWHSEFRAPYTDSLLSLQSREKAKLSVTTTVFMVRRLWHGGSLVFNPEIAGGSGLSKASGVAGALNGETFRVGSAEPALYLARLYVRQRWALNNATSMEEDDLNQLAGPEPTHYLSVTAGKISIADYFDQNSYSHDPRTQFFNWSLMSAGAWDYPANVRGYTVGAVVEYVTPTFALRAATTLVPTYANGPLLDYRYSRAHSETLELTKAYNVAGHPGTVRLLGYRTVAPMGSYDLARQVVVQGQAPDITQVRTDGRTKTGFVVNGEQEISSTVGLFGRYSYNDGRNETWAFTEIDHSGSVGASSTGSRWHRTADRLGAALVVNGISPEHRAYLAAGGQGFIIGDGQLNYALEYIAELYYSLAVPKYHAAISPDYQLVVNPAYNRDRSGPVHVVALRVHVTF